VKEKKKFRRSHNTNQIRNSKEGGKGMSEEGKNVVWFVKSSNTGDSVGDKNQELNREFW